MYLKFDCVFLNASAVKLLNGAVDARDGAVTCSSNAYVFPARRNRDKGLNDDRRCAEGSRASAHGFPSSANPEVAADLSLPEFISQLNASCGAFYAGDIDAAVAMASVKDFSVE